VSFVGHERLGSRDDDLTYDTVSAIASLQELLQVAAFASFFETKQPRAGTPSKPERPSGDVLVPNQIERELKVPARQDTTSSSVNAGAPQLAPTMASNTHDIQMVCGLFTTIGRLRTCYLFGGLYAG
jgi:hypothetical protein